MELMKYEVIGPNESNSNRAVFFHRCMKAEGYVYRDKPEKKYPILDNRSCDEDYKFHDFPPEFAICWIRVY